MMQEHTFYQKKGLESRKFVLKKDRILVEAKDIRKNSRYEISLDQLGFDIYYQADNTRAGKIVFVITTLISIVCFVAVFFTTGKDKGINVFNGFMFALISLFNILKPHKDDVFLTGGEKNLVFYRNKPNEKAVLDFIENVRKATKSFMKEKYTAFNRSTSEEDYYHRLS